MEQVKQNKNKKTETKTTTINKMTRKKEPKKYEPTRKSINRLSFAYGENKMVQNNFVVRGVSFAYVYV